METELIENTMSFEESLKQISPSEEVVNVQQNVTLDEFIKEKVYKDPNKSNRWRIKGNNYTYSSKKEASQVVEREYQREQFARKVNNSNDALINILTSSINEPFICLEVRKLHSQKRRLKTKYKSKFTNNLTMF